MLISTIKNFLDIYGIETKYRDFSPNVLENKILVKFESRVSLVAMAIFRQIFLFLVFFTNSLEIIYGTFFGNISNFACDL